MADTSEYPDMTVFVDGKVARLRASCDACNESKVRCSQAKPKCARCEKQSISCVYGLSRRSHKNAPRIGESTKPPVLFPESHSSPPGKLPAPSHGSPSSSTSSSAAASVSNVSTTDHSRMSGSLPPESKTPPTDPNLLHDNSFISMLIQTPEAMDVQHMIDTNDFSAFNNAFNPMDDLASSTGGYDFLNQCMSMPSPGTAIPAVAGFACPDDMMSTEMMIDEPQPFSGQSCNCANRVMKQLTAMSLAVEDESGPFDAELSQLRRAINTVEDCITCQCILQDQMSLMTASVLMGRVVHGFEATLSKVYPTAHMPMGPVLPIKRSSSTDSSGTGTPEMVGPRLSWGVLQIDPDEEHELKQHLWLLQFRKVQRVLEQLSASVGGLRSVQGGGGRNAAYVMACQCIHMWLAQRAEVVKDKYLAHEATMGAAPTSIPI